MPTFTDAQDREWTVDIAGPQLKQIRKELGVNLLDLSDKNLWVRLQEDYELIVDVLAILLDKQIRQREMNAFDFAMALRGDALDRATDAFIEAHINFFPSRKQAVLRKAYTNTKAVLATYAERALALSDDKLQELAVLEMDNVNHLLNQRIQQLRQGLTGGQSGTSGADTSESTPSETP